MSTNPEMISITVDGKVIETYKGAMLIEATDSCGIAIPRFCYHKKLSIAANCRMCLVEVERAPKPLPACATPVTQGMIVHTRSDKVRAAQKAVMDFLLINHPLDCPICDQGGECELQDLSIVYGNDHSIFNEEKRIVEDKDIGALISTHMTRCIACTRCVRFGEEIASLREMGATGRGEYVKIGTYITQELVSEISANIIDICPVGALTAKPSKFQARPWEYVSHESISIHDGLGTNTHIHTLRGEINRVVPRENNELNEVWISDRDRFSYTSIFAQDRALEPLVKMGADGLKPETWLNALAAARMALEGVKAKFGAEHIGMLISPSSTVEEQYLAQKLARSLGINNIDHRLYQTDFSDDSHDPTYPSLGLNIDDVNQLNGAFLIGADLRMELPLLAIRMRDAVKKGAQVALLSSYAADQLHLLTQQAILEPARWIELLSAVLYHVSEKLNNKSDNKLDDKSSQKSTDTNQRESIKESTKKLIKDYAESDCFTNPHSIVKNIATGIAQNLTDNPKTWLVLGAEAISHPQFATLRALTEAIASLSSSSFGIIAKGGNGAGGYLTGALPHRIASGKAATVIGLNAYEMLKTPLQAYILVGALDLEFDSILGAQALDSLSNAQAVIALTPFASETLKSYATVILPTATWGETAGSLINLEGRCQSVSGAAAPQGQARPLWKVLRVLGNQFELAGFEYLNSDDILDEWLSLCDDLGEVSNFTNSEAKSIPMELDKTAWLAYQGIYQTDAYVRRSKSLQATPLAKILKLTVHPDTAIKLNLDANGALPLRITPKMAENCIRIPQGFKESVLFMANLTASVGE